MVQQSGQATRRRAAPAPTPPTRAVDHDGQCRPDPSRGNRQQPYGQHVVREQHVTEHLEHRRNIAGGSSGVQIVKPDTFANPRLYAYLVAPYILGEAASSDTVQDISTGTDVSTTGALQVAYVADPTDDNAGSWWAGSPYSQYVDLALNHPARWQLSYASQDTSVQGAECLINSDHFTVSCVQLNDPDPSDLWNSEFYWMRGCSLRFGGNGRARNARKPPRANRYSSRLGCTITAEGPAQRCDRARPFLPAAVGHQHPVGDRRQRADRRERARSDPPVQFLHRFHGVNWVLTSASFDSTDLSDTSMIFWVVVWAEDGSGDLIAELPGHGLASLPGTLHGIADAPLEQVTYMYQGEQLTSSFSNNVGYFHLAFYVAPASESATAAQAATARAAADEALRPPRPDRHALRLQALSDLPIVAPLGRKVSPGRERPRRRRRPNGRLCDLLRRRSRPGRHRFRSGTARTRGVRASVSGAGAVPRPRCGRRRSSWWRIAARPTRRGRRCPSAVL
jgi:hypothetical protein